VVAQPPLPLQEFFPLHPLSPVLRPPLPLQEFWPLQACLSVWGVVKAGRGREAIEAGNSRIGAGRGGGKRCSGAGQQAGEGGGHQDFAVALVMGVFLS
jgi:hypothetical protein